MFLLCKHVRLTCGFNKLMMMMTMMIARSQTTCQLLSLYSSSTYIFQKAAEYTVPRQDAVRCNTQ